MTPLQYVDLHLGVVTRDHHFWYYRAQGGRLRALVEDRRRRVADGVTDLASGSSFTKA